MEEIMKIGIIVHSKTGNTYSVALKLMEKLTQIGHVVEITRLNVISNDKLNPQFETLPDIETYDGLIFGSLVEAFTVSPVFGQYMMQLPSLKNKKVACFVTQYFPFKTLGGNQAIRRMKKICESKEATMCDVGIVRWMFSNSRKEQTAEVIEHISHSFE